jgi:F-type H+-transporting ATPase subunit gamma
MPSLRHIRKRIGAVRNTQQITKAMKMVAAAKFRKAQESVLRARPYSRALLDALRRIGYHKDISDHPLMARRSPVQREDLFVLTSDRGLCGSFNANVIHTVEHYLLRDENWQRRDRISIITIGRKANHFFRKQRFNVRKNVEGFLDAPHYAEAVRLAGELARRFIKGETDAVTLVYNEFRSAVQQRVVFETLLPLAPPPQLGDERDRVDYLYEPEKKVVLDQLIRRYLANRIFMVTLESVASEHGARMTAMENATENATDMIQRLTMQYNKARQGAITKELMEIVSGAEAQKASS